uniref:ATP synthase subunit 8 n=1 Tax=Nasonia giraulti TaxID=7426 RepID=B5T2D7_9HYME|nr:ATP synthase F0 subunit 8 [Nasonia giraulti]ACH81756.1 ATP synthase subunit 8 [Nasonia giraulti]ACH85642.1 ATP synthase subunit 8 [Nasonia giraulti]ACH85647.1 ATP synthase subunit 8 [Nasonia giraulti]ACH85655.1 ATP synthase subunit 8 [Nasonia giraulti]ACH85659.1 ATP synthase subunit 8 [Nasonia giraulti]
MPQMSPMMWLSLYLYFIMLLMISMLLLYYLIIYVNIKFNLINKNSINFLNKW